VGVFVDLDDLNLDGLADRQDLRRVVDATPSHVGDVQEAVHAAEVNERTVFGDVLDHAVDDLTFGQVADDFSTLFGTRFFQDGAARHNDVATATVHFQDLEGLLHAHQRASITHGAHVNLRAGQEGHSAAKINGKAAFDAAKDGAVNTGFRSVSFLQTIPGFFAASFLAADLGFTAGILHAVKVNLNFVAHVDIRGFAGVCEFFQIDAAFHFVADVDDGLTRFDSDDAAFDNRALFGGGNFKAFFQKGFEIDTPEEGTVVKGRVIAIEAGQAIIDVGYKMEGRIDLKEFANPGEAPNINVGDEVEVYLDRVENARGEAQISREKARREEAWDRLEKAYASETRVDGAIFGRVKGGFTVDLGGAVAFLPGSQVDVRPVRDAGPLMGMKQPFQILKMDRRRGNIVVSRRAILEESRAEQRAEVIGNLTEGQIVDGVVKNITEYGAFVDLGGVDGLLHVTDMAWRRVNHPSEILTIGETIKVQVIKINKDTHRISWG